jgi:hypothetical protein
VRVLPRVHPAILGALASLVPMGCKLCGVPIDADGIVPEKLEAALGNWDASRGARSRAGSGGRHYSAHRECTQRGTHRRGTQRSTRGYSGVLSGVGTTVLLEGVLRGVLTGYYHRRAAVRAVHDLGVLRVGYCAWGTA